MSERKIVATSVKDDSGIYEKAIPQKPMKDPDVSIDDELKRGLLSISRLMVNLSAAITAGDISRETVGSLKDCMLMLSDLKKKEKEFLDSLTDAELEKL